MMKSLKLSSKRFLSFLQKRKLLKKFIMQVRLDCSGVVLKTTPMVLNEVAALGMKAAGTHECKLLVIAKTKPYCLLKVKVSE